MNSYNSVDFCNSSNHPILLCLKQEVKQRALMVVKVIPCCLKIILNLNEGAVGVAATTFSALCLSQIKELNKLSLLTKSVSKILPRIFKAAMRIMNPNYKTSRSELKRGVISKCIYPRFIRIGKNFAKNKNSSLKRHVVSRALFFTAIPLSIISNTLDLAIIPTSLLSIITLGTQPKINRIAENQLKGLIVLYDASKCFRRVVTPSLPKKKSNDFNPFLL